MMRNTQVLESSWMRIRIIMRKEFSDMVSGKRLWILIGILLVMYVASLASLRLYGTSAVTISQAFSTVTSSVTFMAPLLGIAFGYDAISRERESGTLRLLLSRPVYRDDVINGKILSSLAVTGIIIFASTFLTASVAILFYGVSVSPSDFSKLLIYSISSIVLAFAYYSISLFFSTISKKPGHSLLLSLVVWALFTLILPIVSSIITVFLTPMPPISGDLSGEQVSEIMQDWTRRFREKYAEISSIAMAPSINYHYGNIVNQIFPPSPGEMPIEITRLFPAYYVSVIVLSLYPTIFTILSYLIFVRSEEK